MNSSKQQVKELGHLHHVLNQVLTTVWKGSLILLNTSTVHWSLQCNYNSICKIGPQVLLSTANRAMRASFVPKNKFQNRISFDEISK